MQRRSFLKSLGVLPVMAYFPQQALGQTSKQKLLVLVQLGGGNDSLNTFVPYTNEVYYQARGNLAIDPLQVLPLTSQLGLNPAMQSLLDCWQSGDMAVVQGLGYAQPNRSHFRSIDIWHTASDADEYLQQGWLNQLLPESNYPLQGMVLSGSPAALVGEVNQFSLANANDELKSVHLPDGSPSTDGVLHIMQQRQIYNQSIELLNTGFTQAEPLSSEFAADSFSQDCKLVAQALAAGLQPAIMHLSLGSFDTHSNQRTAHDNLLSQLANGLAVLRQELQAQGRWQDVTIATYSEFGRRVAVNASNGTDHGTAASHLVMGGAVAGGVYANAPSLTELEAGDLHYSEDFRAYYRTLADWMQWQPSAALSEFSNLGFV